MNRETVYVLVFALYTAVVLYIGLVARRQTRTTADFFAGGHSLSALVTFMGYLATGFSVTSILGGPSFAYTWGYVYLLYGPATWTLAVLFGPIIASRIRRVKLISAPEYFSVRFRSKFLQALAGVIIILGLLMGLSVQLNGVAKLLSIITGLPFAWGVILAGAFALAYTSIGGFKAASWTDVLQGIVFVVGVLACTVIVVGAAGGFTAMNLKAATISTPPLEGGKPTPPGTLVDPLALGAWTIPFLLANFLGWGLGTPVHPQYIMRLQGAKSVRAGLSMYYSYILLAVLWICLTVVGVAGRVLVPTLPAKYDSSDWIFPLLVMEYMPSWLGALVFAGAAAAAQSTFDAQLLLCTSSITYDIYKSYINPQCSDEKLRKLSQLTSVLIGLVAIVITFYPPKFLVIMAGFVWGLFAATFFAPIVLGLFWKGATRAGAIASVFVGLIVDIFCQLKFGTVPIHPAAYAVPASILAMILVSTFTEPLPEEAWRPFFPSRLQATSVSAQTDAE